MITFEKECWEAWITTDERNSAHFGYFTKQGDAIEACRGKGWWGGDGTVNRTTVKIKIFESLEEYNADVKNKMKQAALAKLSKEEKELLGL